MPTIKTYLAHITPSQRAAFERVRGIVQHIVPEAEELVSYGVPTFKYRGKPVLYFGAFKHHMSLFPASDTLIAAVSELAPFRSSKGTLQFTEGKPIPETAIERMVLFRLEEILAADAQRRKPTTPPKAS